MRAEHLSGPVAAAVVSVVALAAPAFAQGQPSPPVAATPAAVAPAAGSPGELPPGQLPHGPSSAVPGPGQQGREGHGRFGDHFHAMSRVPTGPTVKLPAPRETSATSMEQALWGRQTMYGVKPGQLTLAEVSELLWAAQGITGSYNRRAAPSLGAAYAVSAHLVAGDVAGLRAGLYRYYPDLHVIELVAEGDRRPEIAAICRFPNLEKVPGIVVLTGDEERIATAVPSPVAARHALAIEAGAASQNVVLEAVALGLGSAVVPDSDAGKLAKILALPPKESPFVVVLVSRP